MVSTKLCELISAMLQTHASCMLNYFIPSFDTADLTVHSAEVHGEPVMVGLSKKSPVRIYD